MKKKLSSSEHKRKKRQEKLIKKRNKGLKKFFIYFLIIASVVLLAYIGYTLDIFRVSKITVKGNKHLAEGQILKSAAPPKEANYFDFPYSVVEKRIKTIPWVESVKVNRQFPGEIIIDIHERKPFAYIKIDNLYYIADYNGYIISAESFGRFKLPVIENTGSEKIAIGKSINDDNYINIVKAFDSLPRNIKKGITTISAPSEEELTFAYKGIDILYGNAEDTKIKSSVIKKFMHSKNRNSITVIDVRVPTRPVIRVIGR